ncbi:PilN domain-containing protein [Shewanella loihica]|uniref:Fimbrial assembly family protein n=1 Tax=Shewanella loihica (strain ATCC BAA-1088 / PV-4) TaxID=323850 RepID=A3Q9W0_SHELP|nr:PilN domain-containing protein [Shewanella loihica]ABO22258.1 Fimbrial assembly family protein [Shewanella loihica PV-4]
MNPKLRVNLFTASLLPPRLRLSFRRLLQLGFGLFVLLLAANLLAYLHLGSLEADKHQLLSDKAAFDQQKAQLEQAIAKRSASQALVQQVDLLSQQVELKRLLLGELSHVETLTSKGYSPLLTGLARVTDDQLWLSRIQVQEDQFVFEGFSAAPNAVPLWLARLQGVEPLKGQTFSTLTMNRGEKQPLGFVLRSKRDEEQAK